MTAARSPVAKRVYMTKCMPRSHPKPLLFRNLAQVAMISRTLRDEIPKFLAEMGEKQRLAAFSARIDPTLLKRGNRVDITAATIRQERVVPLDDKPAQPGQRAKVESHTELRQKSYFDG